MRAARRAARAIAAGEPAALAMRRRRAGCCGRAAGTGVPAALSRDAGRYLCNYLCWRAAEAAGKKGGPRLAAFVHVPKIARTARRPGKRRKLTLDDLTRAGAACWPRSRRACHG